MSTGIFKPVFQATDERRACFTQESFAFCFQRSGRRAPRSKPKANFLRSKSPFASKKGRKWTHFSLKIYVHLRPLTNATQECDDANPIHVHVVSVQSDII